MYSRYGHLGAPSIETISLFAKKQGQTGTHVEHVDGLHEDSSCTRGPTHDPGRLVLVKASPWPKHTDLFRALSLSESKCTLEGGQPLHFSTYSWWEFQYSTLIKLLPTNNVILALSPTSAWARGHAYDALSRLSVLHSCLFEPRRHEKTPSA